MKKLFCFDIDGTLRTTTDHQIPESTIKALNLLREKGHLLLVSTGRSVDSLKNTHIYDTFAFDGYVCNSGQALLERFKTYSQRKFIYNCCFKSFRRF